MSDLKLPSVSQEPKPLTGAPQKLQGSSRATPHQIAALTYVKNRIEPSVTDKKQ